VKLQHVKMTRGIGVNDLIVSIEDSKNGKSCECICIVCHSPLIARQGEKNSWSFAHDFSTGEVDCAWSGETELHLRVKEYLSNSPTLNVPIGIHDPIMEVLKIDEIKLEMKYDPTRRIPDVTIISNGEVIIVEIGVTHFCDNNKISEYKYNNVNALEFDFSKFEPKGDTITDDDIEDYFRDINFDVKWLSVAPAGYLGCKVHAHERDYIFKYMEDIRNIEQEHRLKIQGLQKNIYKKEQELSSKESQLVEIEILINTQLPGAEKIKVLLDEYKYEESIHINKLEKLTNTWMNQARIDAELEFNTELTSLKNKLKEQYIEDNRELIQSLSEKLETHESEVQQANQNLQLIENNIVKKSSSLEQILEREKFIADNLHSLDTKTRKIAQVRIQLNRILPEFKDFYRKTGSPCPFPHDIEQQLNADPIRILYEQLIAKE